MARTQAAVVQDSGKEEGERDLALVRRVLQKLAMSSAEARPPTCLLREATKASSEFKHG